MSNMIHFYFDLARILIAPLRVVFEALQHNIIKSNIHMDVLRRRVKSADWQLAREHFVEDHAE